MKGHPDPLEYEEKKERLQELLRLEASDHIDLFFTDECGFSLTPSIPYGWQPIGIQRSIRSAKDSVTNVFGLLSPKGKLKVFSTPQTINSDFILECVDQIAQSIQKPTVLVMDNAPWHRAGKIIQKCREWEDKELYVFFLPKYSPHLNLIETLWRKIKYEWLKPLDYLSAATLLDALFNIIRQYDNLFCINFSNNFLL